MDIKDRLRSVNIPHEYYVETIWYVDVTDYAAKIFGDVIKKVEVTLYYDEDDIDEAIVEATGYLDDIEKDNGSINFDANSMLITFINGNKVEIFNSEWGGIRTPNNIRVNGTN